MVDVRILGPVFIGQQHMPQWLVRLQRVKSIAPQCFDRCGAERANIDNRARSDFVPVLGKFRFPLYVDQ